MGSRDEVARALVYVMQNVRKHGLDQPGPWLDPLSTAHRFDGWLVPIGAEDNPKYFPPRAPAAAFSPIFPHLFRDRWSLA